MNDPLVPMHVSVDTRIVIDARVTGGWDQDKIDRFIEHVSISHGADEVMDFAPELTMTYVNTAPATARAKVNKAVRSFQ